MKKQLVFYSQTSDAFSDDDFHYVLRDSLGNIYTTKNSEILGLHKKDLEEGEKEFFPLEVNGVALLLSRRLCLEHNLILVDDTDMEAMDGFGSRILYDEDLLNYFIGTTQDYTSEYWSDPMIKELYLNCIDYGMCFLDADNYVHCYELLGRDVGFERYHDISAMLERHGYPNISEADKELNNEAWQLVKEFVEKEGM